MISKNKIIYQGKEISLKLIEKRGLKNKIEQVIVNFPKTVGVLPVDEKGRIILVKQYRFPAKKDLWEIPAGKLKKREKPEIGAKRELKEEAGLGAQKLKKIAEYFVSPGYTSEYQYLFVAKNLKKEEKTPDEGEVIKKIKKFSLAEILKMIKEKKIVDVKTILAIFLYKNTIK
jgi:ADP-ribose pyrophosphatase